MKTQVLLENYDLPGDLERQNGILADQYNNHRYHASLSLRYKNDPKSLKKPDDGHCKTPSVRASDRYQL
ncbi:hypothetical protein [Sedimentitalea arenosa]|uniref:Integrase catalytic domain-containing protein n=1 Tax=Sedimentitalea arenosa TaxID=2798803 RepID=A0A8J7J6R8_9RHOB|nr:hypothetical protein [Arenibacterium arenosum]MBJ6372425.1 hypothetical protein [Arenibacterium arenosum]